MQDKKDFPQKRKRKISDLSLFRSLTVFLEKVTPYIIRTHKLLQKTYGEKIISNTIEIIRVLRESYEEIDLTIKLEKIRQISALIKDIELYGKMLQTMDHKFKDGFSVFSFTIADIILQINGWEASTIKRMQNNGINTDVNNELMVQD